MVEADEVMLAASSCGVRRWTLAPEHGLLQIFPVTESSHGRVRTRDLLPGYLKVQGYHDPVIICHKSSYTPTVPVLDVAGRTKCYSCKEAMCALNLWV